ncbi:MAG TPA: NADH-quinone oxidoreductase subunit J [Bacteroidales bacterium]|nr:NADH-quinone oxidoreductase subunit J [Bacteroidales bacterium]
MSASAVVFYILGALVLTFGILTVFSRKIFRAAVFLLLSLIGIAAIYLIMDMQFVAALQIVIYVGGIVVLIIFSIFLTHQSGQKLPSRLPKHLIWAILVAGAGLLLSTHVLYYFNYTASTAPALEPTMKNIGRQLIDYREYGYVFPFEIVSVLLLAAMIGSIVIAIKTKKNQG